MGTSPYDLWRMRYSANPEDSNQGIYKQFRAIYDMAPKDHLTKTDPRGRYQMMNYISSKQSFNPRSFSIDPTVLAKDLEVHKFMKKTTYKIGHDPKAPKVSTSTKEHFNSKIFEDSSFKQKEISRRADPSNPNRQITVEFGKGAEAGTKADHKE